MPIRGHCRTHSIRSTPNKVKKIPPVTRKWGAAEFPGRPEVDRVDWGRMGSACFRTHAGKTEPYPRKSGAASGRPPRFRRNLAEIHHRTVPAAGLGYPGILQIGIIVLRHIQTVGHPSGFPRKGGRPGRADSVRLRRSCPSESPGSSVPSSRSAASDRLRFR